MKVRLLFFILAFSFYDNMVAQIQSNPEVPQTLFDIYENDVKSLALTRINQFAAPEMNEIEISTEYCDTIWSALAVVYNAYPLPARDTTFDIYCIHEFLISQRIRISSTSVLYNTAWANGVTLTGDIAIDTFISKYNLSLYGYYTSNYFDSHATFTINSYINAIALCNQLDNLPLINYAYEYQFNHPHKEIKYEKDSSGHYLDFIVNWGDCPAGCMYHKKWQFKVNNNYSVEYLGEYQNLMSYPFFPPFENCYITPSIPIYSTNEVGICVNDSIYLNNQWYTGNGTFNDTLLSSIGTDSIVFTTIYIAVDETTNVNINICSDESYVFFGDTLTMTGVYTHTTVSSLGCDSTVSIDLETFWPTLTNEYVEICEGAEYDFFGQQLTISSIYSYLTESSIGCDSTINLELEVLQSPEIQFNENISDTLYSNSAPIAIDTIALPAGGLIRIDNAFSTQDFLDPSIISIGQHWLYYYCVYNSSPFCLTIDSIMFYIVDNNSIIIPNKINKINILPNPVSNNLTIYGTTGNEKIFVYDVFGNKLDCISPTSPITNHNVNNLSKGIYIVQVRLENYTRNIKILVLR